MITIDISLPAEVQQRLSQGVAQKHIQLFRSRKGVIGVIIKSEVSGEYIDSKFIHRHPLFEPTRIDTYCLVGSKEDVEAFIISEIKGEAYLSLIKEYGEVTVRGWMPEHHHEQMEQAIHSTYLKYMLT